MGFYLREKLEYRFFGVGVVLENYGLIFNRLNSLTSAFLVFANSRSEKFGHFPCTEQLFFIH